MGSQSPAMRDPGPSRRRLRKYETFDDAVKLLKSAQNVVILAGAGISTSIGIPDFRSKDGLYNNVNTKKRFADPQQLFTKATFCDAPLDFYSDVMPIIPKLRTATEGGRITKPEDIVEYVPRFSLTHAFFNLLDDKNKLRTIYTQNIDGLEKAAGVESSLVVNCHGSWDSATCMTCRGKVTADDYLPVVYKRALPLCMCAKPVEREASLVIKRTMRDRPKKSEVPVEYLQASKPKLRKSESSPALKKRKRVSQDETTDPQSRPGLFKPDITFFDEGISRAYEPRLLQDATKVDLFVIIGTSLPVEPVNKLPFEIPSNVPQIWISREHCQRAGLKVDIELLGDCDLVAEELCRRAGWTTGLENRLWRNKFGSRQQAKHQLGNLRNHITPMEDQNTDNASIKRESSPLNNDIKMVPEPALVTTEERVTSTNTQAVASNDLPVYPAEMQEMIYAPRAEPGPAVVITDETSTSADIRAVTLNDLPLRPADLRKPEDTPPRKCSPSPAKSKSLPESKVKVDCDLGTEWKWYVRGR